MSCSARAYLVYGFKFEAEDIIKTTYTPGCEHRDQTDGTFCKECGKKLFAPKKEHPYEWFDNKLDICWAQKDCLPIYAFVHTYYSSYYTEQRQPYEAYYFGLVFEAENFICIPKTVSLAAISKKTRSIFAHPDMHWEKGSLGIWLLSKHG